MSELKIINGILSMISDYYKQHGRSPNTLLVPIDAKWEFLAELGPLDGYRCASDRPRFHGLTVVFTHYNRDVGVGYMDWL